MKNALTVLQCANLKKLLLPIRFCKVSTIALIVERLLQNSKCFLLKRSNLLEKLINRFNNSFSKTCPISGTNEVGP